MKKTSILLIASFALFLTACGQGLEEPISSESEVLVGEFKSLGGIRVDESITHLFEDEDGEIYYAYSGRYDLNDSKFFGPQVRVNGVVMEFESLDKDTLEVRRITPEDEEEEEKEVITDVTYKDTDLGFSLTYPDNWDMTSLRDSVRFDAPTVDDEDPDFVIAAVTNASLDDSRVGGPDLLGPEIRSYVSRNFDIFEGDEGQDVFIGIDGQYAVRYKTENGDISYFIPRGAELFELTFSHPSGEENARLKNSNTFADMVASFRFLPVLGFELLDDGTDTEENIGLPDEGPEPIPEPDFDPPEVESTSVEQVEVGSYREFESGPYQFIISYPGNWYYSGGGQGYDFSDEPLEEDIEPIIRLDLNARSSEGIVRNEDRVEITVKVEDRYYTLMGPAEYEAVMYKMADSISITEEEEE